MELDHVLIAVADLEAGARELETRHGLVSVEGGRHSGWGTANRIVPLGDAYLELIAVVDEDEAMRSGFGRWVARARGGVVRPLGWVVRTQQLDDVARRLGLAVGGGSRVGRNGELVTWRLAGVDQAATEPLLPFFIEWGPGTPFPGSAPAAHPAGAVQLSSLRLEGDAERLAAWVGSRRLPVEVRAGSPAVKSIVLTADDGQIVLGDG